MAHLRCDFYSDAAGMSTSMTVILPQQTENQIGMDGAASDAPPPVLYLLHGLSDDDTIWLRRTSIERYAAPLGLAVVMPQVHRSFYANEVFGGAWWDFISEELPSIVQSFFRVSAEPSQTFVAGLSMGGYGSLRLALTHPDRFGAAASLSGAGDLARIRAEKDWPEDPRMFDRIHGPGTGPSIPPEADLFALLEAADPARLPPLYVGCGTEDALITSNRRFAGRATERGIDIRTSFVPGTHEWGLWDVEIQQVLDWLPLQQPTTT